MVAGWGVKMSDQVGEICTAGPVIPVIEIDDENHALPLVEALMAGGINVVEITLRTPQALPAIKLVSGIKGLHVGAGTLLSAKDVKAAKDAGSTFGVSPGSTLGLIEACKQENLPLLPGAATPSEVANLLAHSFNIQKFFPAEAAGGRPMLKAISGPLQDVKFCPTGGVSPDEENLRSWFDAGVTCVGMGSKMITKKFLSERDFDGLQQLVASTLETIAKVRS